MQQTPPEPGENMRQRWRVPALGLGFKKVSLDSAIHERLLAHFRANQRNFVAEKGSSVKTEHAARHPSLLYFDDTFNLDLRRRLKPLHEAWSGLPLTEAACYGIRVYQAGAYLHKHADPIATHVISGTICIDHCLSKPWPLYIEDDQGTPHEISIDPGEMVMYESARLPHGRPHPLDGKFYAGIFVHYTPVDWKLLR